MLVYGPVEIGQLASDFHIRLIDAPTGRNRPAPLPTELLLDPGRIFLKSAVDCRVIDRDAALAHHLLEIAVAYPIAAILTHRSKYGLTLEVSSLEVRHGKPAPSFVPDRAQQTITALVTEPSTLSGLNGPAVISENANVLERSLRNEGRAYSFSV